MATHAAENQAYVLEEKDPVSVVLFFHKQLGHWGGGGGGGGSTSLINIRAQSKF